MGRKINLSGISLAKRSRPGPNSVYMYMDMSRGDNVRVIFGRNRPILGKMGRWDESRGAKVFFAVNQTIFQQLRNGRFPPNLVAIRILVSRRRIRKNIYEIFTFGVICPQNRKLVKLAPHSELATGHGMHCREILFTPRCSPRATELPRSGQLFSTTYGCGWSVKVAQFSDSGLFSP